MTIHYLLVKISTQVLLSPVFKYMLLFLCRVIFSVLMFSLKNLIKNERGKCWNDCLQSEWGVGKI